MSALGDVAAAILPPEAGGPDPERVASIARRMVSRMPPASQAGLAAALVSLEAFSLARTGRLLGAASPQQREALRRERTAKLSKLLKAKQKSTDLYKPFPCCLNLLGRECALVTI